MDIVNNTTEKFVSSLNAVDHYHFNDLGLTDSVILHLKDEYDLLITGDSNLSDYALSMGIKVLDLVAIRNYRLQY